MRKHITRKERRGNGRRDIFLSDDDKNLFLSFIDQLSDWFDIEIFAYVLMDSHYHILLKTINTN
uniref:Uncharacterized protein n=1 Tax=uncultured Desulfobacterium sp. TaxID=201089 RepID=E1YD87_9BACT|nr:hypothetical protein N47_G38550 [uncultured Desulfobacterium sp.]